MRKFPVWLTYTLLRLLFFVAPFVILILFQIPWWVAAIIAAIIGLTLSYIFLAKFRNHMSTAIYEARQKSPAEKRTVDEEHEDRATSDGD